MASSPSPAQRLGGVAVACLGLAGGLLAGTVNSTLSASGGATADGFGGRGWALGAASGGVASDGDLIVVGSAGDDVAGAIDQGSVSVFRHDGATWIEEATLSAAGGAAGDGLGASVAVSGDVLAVGSPGADVGGAVDQGEVTVFRWNGASWIEEATLTAAAGAAGDGLGCAVALRDDLLVAGASQDDVAAASDQGSAVVFRWNGASWVEEATLSASAGAADDLFGAAVALDSDRIVVGAPLGGSAGLTHGAAFVFDWNGSAWIEAAELTSSVGALADAFGAAVAVHDELIVVGSPLDDVGIHVDQGSASVFRWSGSAWVEEAQLSDPAGAANDWSGNAVAVLDDHIAVGAVLDDVLIQQVRGTATLYAWDGLAWNQEDQVTSVGGGPGDMFGGAIALAGDRMVVGAPGADAAELDQGAVYVYDLEPAWSGMGCALAGVDGLPRLTGTGPLSDGSSNAATLRDAAPSATAALFLALASTPVPFKGGTLKPFPFLPPVFLPTDGDGRIHIPFVMPAGIPTGTEIWIQWGIQDGAAIAGVALSNALLGITP